jgi:hypothetical protein
MEERMRELHLFWGEENSEERELIGKLWVEEGKLVMDLPMAGAELEGLVDWLSAQELCSRVTGADFENFEFFTVAATCQTDDVDYLEILQEEIEKYKIGGKVTHVVIVEAD